MMGVIAIRYAAAFISYWTEKFPRLETVGYAMVGWIGIKLGLSALPRQLPHFELIFWFGIGALFLIIFTKQSKNCR
jgi:predicted tellurium resistance membrane protein TerC